MIIFFKHFAELFPLMLSPSYSSLKVNNRSFHHASPRLWNEFPKNFAKLSMIESLTCYLIFLSQVHHHHQNHHHYHHWSYVRSFQWTQDEHRTLSLSHPPEGWLKNSVQNYSSRTDTGERFLEGRNNSFSSFGLYLCFEGDD